MPTKTITIGTHRIDSLQAEVRRLSRHARRLGLSEPTMAIVANSKREATQTNVLLVSHEDGVSESQRRNVVEIVDVQLDTPEMGLSSGKYRTVAALQDLGKDDKGEPMVEVFAQDVESAKKAESYRSAKFCCEHCKTIRQRQWMVLAEEKASGKILQLGNECATLYVADAEGDLKKLQFQELVVSLVREFDGDAERGFGGGGSSLRTVDH